VIAAKYGALYDGLLDPRKERLGERT